MKPTVKKIAEAVASGFTSPTPPEAPKPVAEAAPVEAAPQVEQKNDLILSKPTPELNPRNRAFAEIAARANQRADADAKETLPVTDDDGNEVKPEPQPEEPAAEAAHPAAEATEPTPEPQVSAPEPTAQPSSPGIDPNAEYEFEVDGKKMKFKGAQVVARVQKGETADYRLQLASETLKRAEELEKRVAAQAPQPAAAQDTPAAAQEIPDAALAEAVRFGTNEQATAALAEIQRRAVVKATEGFQNLQKQMPQVVNNQIAFAEATRFANAEYGDLLNDPYLSVAFIQKEDAMRKAGDKRPYVELYKEIGDDIRKHFNRPKPGSAAPAATAKPTPPAPTIEQKAAAKAAAPAAPKLAAVRMEGGQVQKPKTREEVIKQMQERRGQHSLSRR